jgi:hypothetical protein
MSREHNPGLWEAWRKRLQRFDRCQLTGAEFCRREGVAVGDFYTWRRKLRPKPVAVAPTQPTFVPLRLAAAAGRNSAASEVRLQLPNGTRVRLVQPDEVSLRALIAAAGALPAEVSSC